MSKSLIIFISMVVFVIVTTVSLVILNVGKSGINEQTNDALQTMTSTQRSNIEDYNHKEFTPTEVNQYITRNPDKIVLVSYGWDNGGTCEICNNYPDFYGSAPTKWSELTLSKVSGGWKAKNSKITYLPFNKGPELTVGKIPYRTSATGSITTASITSGRSYKEYLVPTSENGTTYISVPILSSEYSLSGVWFVDSHYYASLLKEKSIGSM